MQAMKDGRMIAEVTFEYERCGEIEKQKVLLETTDQVFSFCYALSLIGIQAKVKYFILVGEQHGPQFGSMMVDDMIPGKGCT